MNKEAVARPRDVYLAILNDRLDVATDEAEREVLTSSLADAANYDRSISPLATLARLVEACDAIVSGEAAVLAIKMNRETDRLRPGGTPLHSGTVDAYIRLRELADTQARRPSEWAGPRPRTIYRTERLDKYLKVRQDSVVAKPRPKPASRARRLEEIIGALSSPEDRQDLRFALDKGINAQRELALLKKAIEDNFPIVDLDELLGAKPIATKVNQSADLDDADRRSLAQLRNKLLDNDHLRHFGLSSDGKRIKLSQPPGTRLVEKAELEALMTLLSRTLGDLKA